MKLEHKKEDLDALINKIKAMKLTPNIIPGEQNVAIGITNNTAAIDPQEFIGLDGVKECVPITKPYKLSGRDFKKEDTIIKVKGATFGGNNFVVMAGPCAVESEDQTMRIARHCKEAGAHVLRGGAFKPRTSPYAFQGLEEEGLKILQKASKETGLPVISEALDLRSLELVNKYADIIQIGTRNMQNFKLLEEVGHLKKPVMLKRGFSATIDEWLAAAEYIMQNGNHQVILCERGIRSFDKHTRNLLDLAAVPVVQGLSHLPIVVDPSHGTGHKYLVNPMSRASLAVGANAIIVDVHDRPHEALCDGPQALSPDNITELVKTLKITANALKIDMV